MKPRKYYIGEVRPLGIVLAAFPLSVTIAGAEYEIKDSTGAVLNSGNCQVEQGENGVMFELDTTLTVQTGTPPATVPVFRDGATYRAIFTVTFTNLNTVFMEEVEFLIAAI